MTSDGPKVHLAAVLIGTAATLFAACEQGKGPLQLFASDVEVGVLSRDRGEPFVFEQACVEGDRITVAVVGDIIFYSKNQKQALDSGLGYRSHWENLVEILEAADITYGNFEGTTTCCYDKEYEPAEYPGKVYDGLVHSSHPTYNYDSSLVKDLVDTGFDVVSTANNHAMDRSYPGADDTIEALDSYGLPHTGTVHTKEFDPTWWTTTEAGGIRIAWLACTTSTNRREDEKKQVLRCNDDRKEVVELVEELAARDDIDAVFVTPHTGVQWSPRPSKFIRGFAADVTAAGALAVFANHPHTIQSWDRYRLPDGRDGFAFYSLANFVQSTVMQEKRAGVVLLVGLTKDSTGVAHINGVRYVPIALTHEPGGLMTQHILAPGDDPGARTIPLSRLSSFNVSQGDLVTNPQCDDGWSAPPPFRGFVGDGCDREVNCREGLACLVTWRDGYCTKVCESDSDCPSDPVRGESVCMEHEGDRYCAPTCTRDRECNIDYRCAEHDDGETGGCLPVDPEDRED